MGHRLSGNRKATVRSVAWGGLGLAGGRRAGFRGSVTRWPVGQGRTPGRYQLALQLGIALVLLRGLGVCPRQLELEPVHFLLVLGEDVIVEE